MIISQTKLWPLFLASNEVLFQNMTCDVGIKIKLR